MSKRNGALTHKKKARLISDGAQCLWCGTPEKLTIDHIVPLSKNGSNKLENLQVLCKTCNESKGSGAAGSWRTELKKLKARLTNQDQLNAQEVSDDLR